MFFLALDQISKAAVVKYGGAYGCGKGVIRICIEVKLRILCILLVYHIEAFLHLSKSGA